jgi:benzoyl-CoA reductase subunit D
MQAVRPPHGWGITPDARAALDIGALHARALRMNDDGRVMGHRMTSQCASGCGQFVENIARYLGVSLEDVGELCGPVTNCVARRATLAAVAPGS